MYKTTFPRSFTEGTYAGAVSGRSLEDQTAVIFDAMWNYVSETGYALTGVVIKGALLEFIVPLLLIIGFIAALRSRESLLVPLTLIQFAGLMLSSAGSRYLIFLIPGLYVFLALGLLKVFRLRNRLSPDKIRKIPGDRVLLVSSFLILGFLNVGHNVKTVYQCRTALETNGAESERRLPFFEAARRLKAEAPYDVVMTMQPRVIHYLSGCPTVELYRSGVSDAPEVESVKTVKCLIAGRNPGYLFSDSKDSDFYEAVMKGILESGLTPEEIPLKSGSKRFRLWRLIPRTESVEGGPSES
jgi:hypothetical protein